MEIPVARPVVAGTPITASGGRAFVPASALALRPGGTPPTVVPRYSSRPGPAAGR